MEFKRLSYRNKNNKLLYYFNSYLRQLIPSLYFKNKLINKLNKFKNLTSSEQEQEFITYPILEDVISRKKLKMNVMNCLKLMDLLVVTKKN